MTLLLKNITWRIVATLSFIITTYIKTGSIDSAFDIGLWASGVNIVVYYLHEKAWRGR